MGNLRTVVHEYLDAIHGFKTAKNETQRGIHLNFVFLKRQEMREAFLADEDQKKIDQLTALLAEAHPHVCSLLCPNIRKEGEPWQHVELCEAIRAALDLTPARVGEGGL